MSTSPAKVSRTYAAPGYVSAFRIASLLCLALGVVFIVVALKEGVAPWSAISWIMAAGLNLLYAELADAVGRTAWRVELTAQDLAPALAQLAAMRLQAASNGTTYAPREGTTMDDLQHVLETAEHYHLTVGGRERGPFSVAQVREMYARGTVVLSQPTRLEDGEPGPTVGRLIELE